MMLIRKWLAVLLALSLMAAGAALAEQTEPLEIEVPFDGTEDLVNELDDADAIGIPDTVDALDAPPAPIVGDEATPNTIDAVPNDAGISIKDNFPDAAFREYVAQFDTDGNGSLSDEERAAVVEIDCSERGIASLKGIAYFGELQTLVCHDNKIKSLDVSRNTKLEGLACYKNKLTSLDVSGCTELYAMGCDDNKLTSLDVSKNTKLEMLWCNNNQLTSLDVRKCPELTELVCYDNGLTALYVTKNTKLKNLECGGNQLTSLIVKNCLALEKLHCWQNNLKKLDVSQNARLKELRLNGNQLTEIDLSHNKKLTNLNCSDNRIAALDVTGNTSLVQINCYNNKLKSLDVSKNKKLIYLFTYGNQIDSIDLKNCPTLRGYLKNKVWEEEDFIAWSYKGEDDLWGLGVDYGTTLTNGSKRLYPSALPAIEKPDIFWQGDWQRIVVNNLPKYAAIKSVKSSKPSVIQVIDGNADRPWYLHALKAGNSRITVKYKQKNGLTKSLSVKLTVKKYPNAIKAINLNGKKLSIQPAENIEYQVHNYKKSTTTLKVTANTGWKVKKITLYLDKNGGTVKELDITKKNGKSVKTATQYDVLQYLILFENNNSGVVYHSVLTLFRN